MREKRAFSHLSLYEREQVFVYKRQGKSLRAIGRLLKRSHSTISREIKHNSKPHELMRGYLGNYAHAQAKNRKIQAGKRLRLKAASIRHFVQEHMKIGWTPEIISHRVKEKFCGLSISHEAIYQYVYNQWTEGINYLPRRHRRRYAKRYSHRRNRAPIPHRVSIDQRPAYVNERQEWGHWESDSIESNQSTVIVQVVEERISRFVKLTRLENKTALLTKNALINRLNSFPKEARRSITYDNGSENYHHFEVNKQLGTQSYFCHPYHSWEKGAVENTNGLIRRFIPKKTDLATISQEYLDHIEYLLNHRPRKCLGFQTPAQVFLKFSGAIPS